MTGRATTLLLPQTRFDLRARALTRDALLVFGFSLFVALSAQVTIPLPGTPVPITGHTFGVLLTGALLGSGRGFLALALYLLEGALGLPVFAQWHAGLHALLATPSAGYLWACPFAAAVVGALAERGWDRRFGTTALAMLAGNAVFYLFGLPWLARFVGAANALPMGLYPFLPGDTLKLVLAAALLPAAWRRVHPSPQP
jgi:biotin transport system substrate-specific component